MDDAAGVMIMVMLFCAAGIAILFYQLHQSRELNSTFARVARRVGGRCIHGGLFGRPSVRFSHESAAGVLEIISNGTRDARYFTQLRITWPDPAMRVEIYPERVLSRIGKLLGMGDLQIGSPKFDNAYYVSGNDADGIRDMLNPAVQMQVDRLRHFMNTQDIYIGIIGGRLTIKKQSLIRDEANLLRYLKLCLEFFDLAANTACEGIEFVDHGQASVTDVELMCQICGDRMTQDVVYCRSCDTPHHKDCWNYYGACSTYGCGQKKYERHRRRQPGHSSNRARR